jgi:hypothetical protein
MAISIVVAGRGQDERLPDVKVMDPWGISGAACHTTDAASRVGRRRRGAVSFPRWPAPRRQGPQARASRVRERGSDIHASTGLSDRIAFGEELVVRAEHRMTGHTQVVSQGARSW